MVCEEPLNGFKRNNVVECTSSTGTGTHTWYVYGTCTCTVRGTCTVRTVHVLRVHVYM